MLLPPLPFPGTCAFAYMIFLIVHGAFKGLILLFVSADLSKCSNLGKYSIATSVGKMPWLKRKCAELEVLLFLFPFTSLRKIKDDNCGKYVGVFSTVKWQ